MAQNCVRHEQHTSALMMEEVEKDVDGSSHQYGPHHGAAVTFGFVPAAVLTGVLMYCLQLGYRHQGYLRPGGALVMKVYEGAGVNEFIRDMQVEETCYAMHWHRG